ncbi:MAG: hypothetical protein ABSC51_08420 [Gaiellaceae bacterium]|jgi:hypothetical protein
MNSAPVQVVVLPPGLRSYSVLCERCLEQASPQHGYFGSFLEGELPQGVPRLAARCPRGHPVTLVASAGVVPERRKPSGVERTIQYSTV